MKRKGFTLMELMVVIAIIVILAGITLYFWPKREVRLAADGADRLQTAFASARSKAVRDQYPCGIRLIPDAMNPGMFTSYVMISPEFDYCPYTPDFYRLDKNGNIMTDASGNPIPKTMEERVMFSLFRGLTNNEKTAYPAAKLCFELCELDKPGDYNNGAYHPFMPKTTIEAGDYLYIAEWAPGSTHRVNAVNGNKIYLVTAPTTPEVLISQGSEMRLWNSYRFICQPRPMMGEVTQQLPNHVFVAANAVGTPGNPNPIVPDLKWGGSQNIPKTSQGNYDIIFAPSGQVINQSAGRIVLWMADDNNISKPTLLTIYTKTGAVAAHPVADWNNQFPTTNPGNDPYKFTKDGRSSGQ